MRRSSLPLSFVAALVASAAAEPLQEAKWLAPGSDISALTMSPGECARTPDDPETAYLAEVGRAAFSSPFLFGGQAARGGLSCASCHTDGRRNAEFFLEGVSREPGTADVSSSIFSKVRDDGVFNPAAIPSLVGIGRKKQFGTVNPAPSLRDFIASAVVDEFQGAKAPPAVTEGLAAYIELMDEAACPAKPSPLSPRRAMRDVERTLGAAEAAVMRNDAATADFLLVSAQAALGRIHERFPGERDAALRQGLTEISTEIGAARNLDGTPKSLTAALDEIEGRAKKLGKRLEKARHHSLYDAAVLARHLGGE